MRFIQRLKTLTLAACMVCVPAFAQAQSYPSTRVKIVVAFGPGVDTGARLLAKALSEKWGQPVIVENRPGAGGNIAPELIARSPGDGSIFLLTGRNIIVNPFLFDTVSYTPMKDLLPVSLFANLPFVIVTHPSDSSICAGAHVARVDRLCTRESWEAELWIRRHRHHAAHQRRVV